MINTYQKFQQENKIGVSCSIISLFNTNRKLFFDIINDRNLDEITTYSALGTIIHYCASQYIKREVKTLKQDIIDYINSLPIICDKELILQKYSIMANTLFKWCDNILDCQKILTEKQFTYNLSEKIVLNGTCDLILNNNTLIDFKTTSQLSQITKMPDKYKTQLLSYIYLLQKNDIYIDYAKIVYITQPQLNKISEKTGKQLKDYPCQVYELGLPINDDSLIEIEETLNLINDSINFYLDNPEYKYLITLNKEDKIGN